MKQIHFSNLVIALILGLCIYLNYHYYVVPRLFLQSISASAGQTRISNAAAVAEAYTFHIDLSQTRPGTLNTYLPRFEPTEEAAALRTLAAFGFPQEDTTQTETATIGYNYTGILWVYRYERGLRYLPVIRPMAADTANTPTISQQAKRIAKAFINEKSLYTPHYEIEVSHNNPGFTISFINRLGGLKNYSFVTSMALDAYGQILEFNHTAMTFERLSTHPTISMEQASTMLPTDAQAHIHITEAELVYTLANSIVQPAFLFTGHLDTGEPFRYFVLAAEF